MEARAVSRFIRISPRKARLVADLIRGKNVDEALGILALTPKKASPILRKTMLSAAANVAVQGRRGVEPSTDSEHLRQGDPDRRGPDAEADPSAGPGPGFPHQQADEPHQGHGRADG